MNDLAQILETVTLGILVLDRDLKVRYWNRWMESHSGIPSERIAGLPLFDYFPDLNTPKFLRACRSVLTFGNFSFFSQKLHRYLFPFQPVGSFESRFEKMQQSCSMGPLRDDSGTVTAIYITVQDVTELAAYEHRLLEMNLRDGLTGVYNRRFLENRLGEEFNRHARYGGRFSIIMFDIDFFKEVNDTHGHQCGDSILKNISATISSMIRKTDFLARYGGEEFCCLLPETGLESAAILAERFRSAVENLVNVYQDKTIRVTISLGISEMGKGNSSPPELLKMADDALYAAKTSGRNRVVVPQPRPLSSHLTK